MNRFDRVTSILILLQSRRSIRAQDLADRFEVSLRTIYRDVNTLIEAGIPIIGEAGIGYSIMDGYRLPPVMFSKEEAISFLTAEKLMEKQTDGNTRKAYGSAMAKIRSVLRNAEKNLLEDMEEHIEVRQNIPFSEQVHNTYELFLQSVSEGRTLHATYQAATEEDISEREIEPLGVYHESNYWYAIAWCRLRNGYRQFRLDRILQLQLTGNRFKKRHSSLKAYLDETRGQHKLEEVVIRVDKYMLPYLQNQKYNYGFLDSRLLKDQVEMRFLSASTEAFARWFLMFADKGSIISPESVRNRAKALASHIAGTI